MLRAPRAATTCAGWRATGAPECAGPVRLALGGAASPLGALVAMLMFAWVAVAGGAMAANYGQLAHWIAVQPRRLASMGITFSGSDMSFSRSVIGSYQSNTGGTTFGNNGGPATPPPLAWGSVAAIQWVWLGMAAAMSLAGIVGLAAAWWSRRAGSAKRERSLVGAATTLFLLWGAWYVWIGVGVFL